MSLELIAIADKHGNTILYLVSLDVKNGNKNWQVTQEITSLLINKTRMLDKTNQAIVIKEQPIKLNKEAIKLELVKIIKETEVLKTNV